MTDSVCSFVGFGTTYNIDNINQLLDYYCFAACAAACAVANSTRHVVNTEAAALLHMWWQQAQQEQVQH